MNEAHPGNQREPEGNNRPEPSQGAPAPGPVDPEQLRQFEQFQQFQNFLRYTQAQQQTPGSSPPNEAATPAVPQALTPYGQPAQGQVQQPYAAANYGQVVRQSGQSQEMQGTPASPGWPANIQPGPATETSATSAKPAISQIKLPRWARKILGKVLSIILLIVALVIAGNLLYDHFFPSSGDSTKSLVQSGGGTFHTNDILPHLPYESVRAVYEKIAQNNSQGACGAMDTATQQKFAADFQAPDCPQAVSALAAQVTNVNEYAESLPSSVSGQESAPTLDISSCAFEVKGGPSLGKFTTTQVEKGQWLIVGHQNEPNPCPAPAPETSPTP